MKQLSQIYLVLLLICGTTACTTVEYYGQAISGHIRLLANAQPISDVIADPETTPALRNSLRVALDARIFARDSLALPVGDAFLEYTELGRPWVVVNLVAVPEFSLTPHHWCYPVLGCQAYRGYFNLDDAKREQSAFKQQGFDTFIGAVTAYSTLGWFDDPLQSGFTALSNDRMVALMFHELAHRVVYVDNATDFNESFATAVELEGLRRWLIQRGEADHFPAIEARLERRRQTQALVTDTTNRLKALYRQADTLAPQTLRDRKQALLNDLAERYAAASEHWAEPGPFGPPPVTLNNANLALFRQYNHLVPGFRQLLKDCDNRFPVFYDAVKTLASLPEEQRSARLRALSQRFTEDL
ncbi:MAG: aminopeptidase [Marinobacter sp.]|nr:aminopeptidase [Marinobacter sp.]